MVGEKLKGIGGTVGGLLLMLAVIAIPVLLLFGAAEFSVWALDWIPDVIGIAVLASIVLVLLAAIPGARFLTGSLLGVASTIFTVCAWLYCLAFTYIEWGMIAVVIGVLFFGFGVVITGILAAIFSATWSVLGNIAILFGLGLAARFFASWMLESAERRLIKKRMEETPSEVILTQPGND